MAVAQPPRGLRGLGLLNLLQVYPRPPAIGGSVASHDRARTLRLTPRDCVSACHGRMSINVGGMRAQRLRKGAARFVAHGVGR